MARELETGIAALAEPYGLELTMEFELPQYGLRGAFLTGDSVKLEVIEFADEALARQRLRGDCELVLDHTAYVVADIEATAKRLRSGGTRFCAPDGTEIEEPLSLAGARHLWTMPSTTSSVCLQLIQLP